MMSMEVISKHLMPAEGPTEESIERGIRMMTG